MSDLTVSVVDVTTESVQLPCGCEASDECACCKCVPGDEHECVSCGREFYAGWGHEVDAICPSCEGDADEYWNHMRREYERSV